MNRDLNACGFSSETIAAESDGELSIAEAVELAAFRMGVENPQTVTEPGEGP